MSRMKLAEGKTKIIWSHPTDLHLVTIESKDDLTAGDGAKHDVLAGKAALANQTTCNVFRLLQQCQVETAFRQQLSDTEFEAVKCDMVPLEVVVRREAHGSYLKRHPQVPKGQAYPQLLVEFYLKTAGKVWNGQALPKDDPLLLPLLDGQAMLFRPDLPIQGTKPFLEIDDCPLGDDPENFERMSMMARRTFLILEKCWQLLGRRLVDMKMEFGLGPAGKLMLADVIDNDAWRVLEDGAYIDKQVYRDGGALDTVAERYARVQQLTGQFAIPKQSVIVWRGSESDDVTPFADKFYQLADDRSCRLNYVTCSMHKSPVRGLDELGELLQEWPDSVVIAYVGRSNGAGPTLAAHAHVPVITVPASYREFPDDIWSSLRAPSDVPVLTVLEPGNAMLAALQILAQRNPVLYAALRQRLEERLQNIYA